MSAEEKLDKAQSLVFGPEYQHHKNLIDTSIKTYTDSVQSALERQMEKGRETVYWSILVQWSMIALLGLTLCIAVFCFGKIARGLALFARQIQEGKPLHAAGVYELSYLADSYNELRGQWKQQQGELRHQAETDPLTSLFNRRSLQELAEKKIETGQEGNLALMVLDIDKFKVVNDRYGHHIGDEALQEVGQLLRNGFRREDIVARLGGDEFAVLILGERAPLDRRIPTLIAQINEMLGRPTERRPAFSISAGYTWWQKGEDLDALYSRADHALYQVKSRGGRGVALNRDGEST